MYIILISIIIILLIICYSYTNSSIDYFVKGIKRVHLSSNTYNPSIVFLNGKLFIYYRLSNKICGKEPNKVFNDGILYSFTYNKSKNINFKRTFSSKTSKEVVWIDKFNNCNNYGVEDIRLFIHKNELYGIGNYVDKNCSNKIVIYNFFKDNYIFPKEYDNLNKGNQKNWSPVDNSNYLTFVYTWYPYIVIYLKNNDIKILKESSSNEKLKGKRGGTQVIGYKNNYFSIVHSRELYGKNYKHNIVKLDKNLNIVKVTKEFCLNETNNSLCGIEFASGMAIHDKKVYISYGSKDCKSKMLIMNINRFLKFIENN